MVRNRVNRHPAGVVRLKAVLCVAAAMLLPAAAFAGTITGKVIAGQVLLPRVASRYAGAGAEESRTVDAVPTIVFIDGRVAATAPPQPGAGTIRQRNRRFEPAIQVLAVGSRVAFPNDDTEFHNVFSYSKPKRFDLGRYPRGESKTVLFDSPGIVKVYCEIHPWMRAAVVVVENPFYAVVGGDGRFRIEGVPPGKHELVAWSIDAGSARVAVDVPADGSRETELKLGAARPAVTERVLVAATPASGDGGPCCGALP